MLEFFQFYPGAWVGVVAVLGLLVGSFLNVVVHRLPIMLEQEWKQQCQELDASATPSDTPAFNLITPRSRCPQCNHLIRWHENIPLFSFLLQKGRCNACANPISWRYPTLELISGLAAGFTAWHFGASEQALFALILVWSLLALTFIDVETYLLPDAITLPLLWLGLLVNLGNTFTTIDAAVVGAAAGYLSLWLVFHLFKLVTGKEGMGYGDFKLLAALGAWLGWTYLPLIILASSLVGALIGLSLIVLAGRNHQKPIPFGPYLAGGGLIALFWGDTLIRTYMT